MENKYKKLWVGELNALKIKEILGEPTFKSTYAGQTQVMVALTPCGFDIENYKQYMYIWTMTINDTTIMGRTWEQFFVVLSTINSTLKLDKRDKLDKKGNVKGQTVPYVLPIFIHNLSHEWSFIRNWIRDYEVFYMDNDNRSPMYVLWKGFLLIDSYKIFPKKLEEVAKSYCITQKTHDLDYSVPRNYKTVLTEKELEYCCNDTRILVELAQFVFDNYFIPTDRLPLTQNQIVKNIIRKKFNEEKTDALVKKLNHMTMTQDQYMFIRHYGFRGGYCGSSLRDTGEEGMPKVGYVDLTSAYMTAICHGYYPVTPFKAVKASEAVFNRVINNKCVYALIKFFDLRVKGNKAVILESKSSIIYCMPDGSTPKTKEDLRVAKRHVRTNSSGRIIQAKSLIVSLNEIDWELYNLCYSWSSFEIIRLETADRGSLPDYVKETAISLYKHKAELKKAGIKNSEYEMAKTLVSNVFGAIVQRLSDDLINGSKNNWLSNQLDSCLKPQWGCYITAHVRSMIVKTIVAIGRDNWLYSDTDSIYFILNDRTMNVVNMFNVEAKAKNAILCKQYNLDYALFDDLGCFDNEGKNIIRFKTLGAKSYLYYYTDAKHPKGAFKYVVSGVPEKFFWKAYFKKYDKLYINKVFDFFEDFTKIEYTRTEVHYVDTRTTDIIDGVECVSLGGAIIEEKTIHGEMKNIQESAVIERVISELNDKRK